MCSFLSNICSETLTPPSYKEAELYVLLYRPGIINLAAPFKKQWFSLVKNNSFSDLFIKTTGHNEIMESPGELL